MPDGNWIAFDTEFIEDGTTIELLSIGLIRHDGTVYYAEPAETDRTRANAWVTENVLPSLTGPVKPSAQIAAEIVGFAGPDPQFWAYYADYDWVALCQLYGTMMDLPDGWPMYCRDLKQYADERGLGLSQPGSTHNALDDAIWVAKHVAHGLSAAAVEDDLRNAYESWYETGTTAMRALHTIWQALGPDRKHLTFGDNPQRVVDETLRALNNEDA